MSATTIEREDLDRPLLPEKWAAAKAGDQKAIAWMVERYHWLPSRIARSKRVPPLFDREDLISWANGGLFDAVRKFKPETNDDGKLHEHFIGYATLRVNGAILDGMKAPGQSWATRDAWRKVKAMHFAESEIAQTLGRPATPAEVAEHLGIAVKDLPMLRQQVQLDVPYGEHDQGNASFDVIPDHITTEDVAEVNDIAERLAAAITSLPEAGQEILAELYFHGADVNDVAAVTGAQIVRVKRSRLDALMSLRDALQRF